MPLPALCHDWALFQLIASSKTFASSTSAKRTKSLHRQSARKTNKMLLTANHLKDKSRHAHCTCACRRNQNKKNVAPWQNKTQHVKTLEKARGILDHALCICAYSMAFAYHGTSNDKASCVLNTMRNAGCGLLVRSARKTGALKYRA